MSTKPKVAYRTEKIVEWVAAGDLAVAVEVEASILRTRRTSRVTDWKRLDGWKVFADPQRPATWPPGSAPVVSTSAVFRPESRKPRSSAPR